MCTLGLDVSLGIWEGGVSESTRRMGVWPRQQMDDEQLGGTGRGEARRGTRSTKRVYSQPRRGDKQTQYSTVLFRLGDALSSLRRKAPQPRRDATDDTARHWYVARRESTHCVVYEMRFE
jgi:hypothetical protein